MSGSDPAPSLFDLIGEDPADTAEPTPSTPAAPTWTVAELHRVVGRMLVEQFGPEIWIEGEIRNLNRSKNGHVYFDLVDSERAEETFPPALAVTLFERDKQVVNRFLREQGGNVRINDGVRVRIRGRLGTFASRSSLQLRMTGIDPKFTLGVLELIRQQVLATLAAEGLLDRNSLVPLAVVPCRVALVTSIGSAAHADALHELEGAALGMQLFVFDTRVQGSRAGESLATALAAADAHGVDLILLVRGGGSRTDLAAFDLEVVARAIALSSVPVFTGIGHEVDTSISDRVAHSSFKTPTAAAAAVCEMIRIAAERFEECWRGIVRSQVDHLNRLQTRLDSTTSALERSSARHLHRRDHELRALLHSIRLCSVAQLDRAEARNEAVARRLSHAPRRSLELRGHRLDAMSAVARAHDPRIALARGWSITRDSHGRVVRSVDSLGSGEPLTTELADGVVTSVVTDTEPATRPDPGPIRSEETAGRRPGRSTEEEGSR